MDKVYRLGELFCGPGGIGRGAVDASLTVNGSTHRIAHAWATDVDPDSCNTYFSNLLRKRAGATLITTENDIPHRHTRPFVLCRDVRKVNFSTFHPVNGLSFGFPCNDFSLIGEQRGISGNFGALYTYGVEAIRALTPDWFIAENVGGLRSADQGASLSRIIRELETVKPGYNVVAHYFKFEEYGLPQCRHRIILVGFKNSLKKEFLPPAPTHIGSLVSAGDAISRIDTSASHQERTRQSDRVVRRLEEIRPGQNAWTAKLPPHLRLNVKGARLSQIYKRLREDLPAYTITGSGGGGTHVYHWSEPRALTNRERAKLQSFPDDYEFSGTKEKVRKQIGMAVPPLGAEIILNAVLKTLAGVKYTWVRSNWQAALVQKKPQQRIAALSAKA